MKRRLVPLLFGALVVVFLTYAFAQQQSATKIALTSSSTVSTADIVKNLAKKCPSVTVTLDTAKADYMLEAAKESTILNGTEYFRFKFTLFDRQGNAVFSTSTRRVDNAVKDLCAYINHRK